MVASCRLSVTRQVTVVAHRKRQGTCIIVAFIVMFKGVAASHCDVRVSSSNEAKIGSRMVITEVQLGV